METNERFRELNVYSKFPQCIEIQTSNTCNARCGVCPYESTLEYEKRHLMDTNLLSSILKECAKNSEEIELLVPYLNNEPFADKRMLNVLREIRHNIRVPTEVSTNASLLTEERAIAITSEGLISTLRISFFGGSKDTYERRMKGLSWERTTKNIDFLLSLPLGKMQVEIIMIATPDLSDLEVQETKYRWEHSNVTVRTFGYLDRAGNCDNRNLLPSHQQWGRIIGCDLNRPFERMVIRHNGDCVLCSQDWRGQVNLGNVNESSIAEVWQSTAYSELRAQLSGVKKVPDKHLCRSCKLALVE